MLKELARSSKDFVNKGLNPYFNGTCSKSYLLFSLQRNFLHRVLILILMEHAQRVKYAMGV